MTTTTTSLVHQLACAKRELKQRQRVYPRLTYMSEAKKADELATMQAIIDTLTGLIQRQQLDLFPEELKA